MPARFAAGGQIRDPGLTARDVHQSITLSASIGGWLLIGMATIVPVASAPGDISAYKYNKLLFIGIRAYC